MVRGVFGLLVCWLALSGLPGTAFAQGAGWQELRPVPAEQLRSTTFDLQRSGILRAIRLEVERGQVFVGLVEIHYRQGGVLEVELNQMLRPGVGTGPIEIDRGRVERIVVHNGAAAGERAEPRIVLHVRGEAGPGGPPPGGPPGWLPLADLTFSPRWTDVTVRVGREAGMLSAIRFVAADWAINIGDIEIVFGDGSRQQVRVRPLLRQQSETRAIELDGGARFVREITFSARAVGGAGARSRLLVEGEPARGRRPGPPGAGDGRRGAIELCLRHRARSPQSGWQIQNWVCTTPWSESEWLDLGDDTGWRSQQLMIMSSGPEFCFAHERVGARGNRVRTGWVCSRGGRESEWIDIGDDTGYRDQRIQFRLDSRADICGRFSDRPRPDERDISWQCGARGEATPWISLGDDTGYRHQNLQILLR